MSLRVSLGLAGLPLRTLGVRAGATSSLVLRAGGKKGKKAKGAEGPAKVKGEGGRPREDPAQLKRMERLLR